MKRGVKQTVMNVRVEFTSTIKELVGEDSAVLNLPARSSVARLLEALEEKYSDNVTGRSQEYQWRHSTDEVMLVLNGEVVHKDSIANLILKEGDVLALVPPHSGG